MTITLSLHWQQIVLSILELAYIVSGIKWFGEMTTGPGDAGLVGFMGWLGIGFVLQAIILMFYFSLMYFTS